MDDIRKPAEGASRGKLGYGRFRLPRLAENRGGTDAEGLELVRREMGPRALEQESRTSGRKR